MTDSRLQQALGAPGPGVGRLDHRPELPRPREFARAGYDYVGFDVQHGYLDDADVAVILRRLEHVPIATAVRLPSNNPAPIGRCSTPEPTPSSSPWSTPGAGRRRGGRPKVPAGGVRASDRCGRASAAIRPNCGPGQHLRHDQDGRRTGGGRGDLFGAGLSGIYVGPADLAISLGVPVARPPPTRGARRDRPRAGGERGRCGRGHPCRQRCDRKGTGRVGLSADHPGRRVPGAARGRPRISTTRRATMSRVALVTGAARGQARRSWHACGPTASRWPRPTCSRSTPGIPMCSRSTSTSVRRRSGRRPWRGWSPTSVGSTCW